MWPIRVLLTRLLAQVSHIPAPFQKQVFEGTPKWLESVINGEVVGTNGAEGKDEECVVM